jgi:hypothetical protein
MVSETWNAAGQVYKTGSIAVYRKYIIACTVAVRCKSNPVSISNLPDG